MYAGSATLEPTEVFITAFTNPQQDRAFRRRYELLGVYHPYVAPDYYRSHPRARPLEISVYKVTE
jgi:hypothetical protein